MPQKDRAAAKEYKRLYYLKNREKYVQEKRDWNKNNKHIQRARDLKKKYNLTQEDYNTMFVEQRGLCAICNQPSKKTLCIDHNHTTGQIRGLLCFFCNFAIGYMKDNPQYLMNGAKYLKKYQE